MLARASLRLRCGGLGGAGGGGPDCFQIKRLPGTRPPATNMQIHQHKVREMAGYFEFYHMVTL